MFKSYDLFGLEFPIDGLSVPVGSAATVLMEVTHHARAAMLVSLFLKQSSRWRRTAFLQCGSDQLNHFLQPYGCVIITTATAGDPLNEAVPPSPR